MFVAYAAPCRCCGTMRTFLKKYPAIEQKIEKIISIPVLTNDELVTFARTYAAENGCQLDDLGVLALYTMIGNNQTEDEPVTISQVKEMMDAAIDHATHGRHRGRRGGRREKLLTLHEKDFI